VVTSTASEEQSRADAFAKTWVAEKVRNLERGSRLARVKLTFSLAKL
jgi:hypothetical protein